MNKLRLHHNHRVKKHQQRRQHREEIARKRHEKWLKRHREARAREPRIIWGFIAVRGGTRWGPIRVKRPSRMKREIERIELVRPISLQKREMRRAKTVVLPIIIMVIIAVVTLGCFFLIVSH